MKKQLQVHKFVVTMPTLPKCTFCAATAQYDGKTLSGPWAYMCHRHFVELGVGLGLGKGQMLIPNSGTK